MRAARFHGPRDVRIDEVDAPAAPTPRQVRVAPRWCGICGTDVHEFTSGPILIPTTPHPLTRSQAPQILGHEFSAVVQDIGDEVTNVRAGDRVSVMPLIVCGRCPMCLRGRQQLCLQLGATGLSSPSGGLAEQTVVADYQVARLDDDVTDIQGALVEPAAAAACGVDRAGLRPGETVLVTGVGPIGALAALYATAAGLEVIMLEANPARIAFAGALDLGPVLDARSAGVLEGILELTDGLGVDAVIECSGNEAALNTALDAVAAHGTVVQTGLFVGPATLDPMRLTARNVTVAGTWCFPMTDWPRIIRLLGSGRFAAERVVTAQIGLDDLVAQGLEALAGTQVAEVKVLVSPTTAPRP